MSDLLKGAMSGLVGLVGLLLCNGLLSLGWTWTGELLAVGVAAAMAMLGATIRSRAELPAWGSVLLTAIAAGLMAGPNPSLENEYGIDRFLLLPRQALLLAGPPPFSPGLPTLICILGAAFAGGCLAYFVGRRRQVLIRCILVYVVLSFLVAACHMNPAVYRDTAAPPQPKAFVMDCFLWLRLHDLMQQGQSYYPAFYTAYTDRTGETGIPGNWLNWRPPVIFYLWQVVPGGPLGLLYAFWVLTAITLVAAFLAMREATDESLALWSPVLLAAYFLYGADSIWYTSLEWWGSCFMILGICAWMRRQPILGAALWALAVTSREHFGFLMPLMLLMTFRKSRREQVAAWLSVGFVSLVYIVHYSLVAKYVVPNNPGIKAWSEAGLSFIHGCLQFSSVYLAGRAYLLMPLFALGAAGALLVRERPLRLMLGWIVFFPICAYMKIGGPERMYWGIVLAPQLLLCVPLFFQRFDPPAESAVVGE